jgi:hypothetical protein
MALVMMTLFLPYKQADFLTNATHVANMKKLIFYSFVLLLSQCNKYDDTVAASHLQVPPFTETGANTFGCLINGEVWANFGETYVHEELGGQLTPNVVRSGFYFDASDSIFSVGGRYTLSKNGTVLKESGMSLQVPKTGSLVGVHQLTARDGLCSFQDMLQFTRYASLARNPFTVTIKKDSITPDLHHVVSGTFSGTIYRVYPTPDSLRIIGGVFDTLTQ